MVDCSIVEAYKNFKITNIVKYTNIILKCIYGKNYNPSKATVKQLEECVYKHLKDFFYDDRFLELSRPDINQFFKDNNIDNKNLQKVLFTMFNKIISINSVVNNEINKKTCLMLANSILISMELDNLTNSLFTDNLSYKLAINDIKNRYEGVFVEDILKNMKYISNLLNEEVNKSIKVNKLLLNHYNNDDFTLMYSEIKDVVNNENMFYVYLDVTIPKLIDKTKSKKDKIISDNKLSSPLISISLDKLNYSILNLFIEKRRIPTFMIDMTDDYFKTKKNTNNMISYLDNSITKDNIVIVVGSKDLIKNYDNLSTLAEKGINLGIREFDYCNTSKKELAYFNYMIVDYNEKDRDNKITLASTLDIKVIVTNVNDDEARNSCIGKGVKFIRNNKDKKMKTYLEIMGEADE